MNDQVDYRKLKSDVFNVSIIKTDMGYGFYDLYSGNFIKITDQENADIKDNSLSEEFLIKYNVEHIIPSSAYGKKWEIFSDLHNLIPSIKILNDYRSNMPILTLPKNAKKSYTICSENDKYSTYEKILVDDPKCIHVSIGIREGSKNLKNPLHEPNSYNVDGCINECYFEPADTKFKGMIARAVLYFNSKYRKFVTSESLKQKYLSLKILSIMRDWNSLYPPTQYEISRNFEIYKQTKTINSFFIDALKNLNLSETKNNLLEFSPQKIIFKLPFDFFKM